MNNLTDLGKIWKETNDVNEINPRNNRYEYENPGLSLWFSPPLP